MTIYLKDWWCHRRNNHLWIIGGKSWKTVSILTWQRPQEGRCGVHVCWQIHHGCDYCLCHSVSGSNTHSMQTLTQCRYVQQNHIRDQFLTLKEWNIFYSLIDVVIHFLCIFQFSWYRKSYILFNNMSCWRKLDQPIHIYLFSNSN